MAASVRNLPGTKAELVALIRSAAILLWRFSVIFFPFFILVTIRFDQRFVHCTQNNFVLQHIWISKENHTKTANKLFIIKSEKV